MIFYYIPTCGLCTGFQVSGTPGSCSGAEICDGAARRKAATSHPLYFHDWGIALNEQSNMKILDKSCG